MYHFLGASIMPEASLIPKSWKPIIARVVLNVSESKLLARSRMRDHSIATWECGAYLGQSGVTYGKTWAKSRQILATTAIGLRDSKMLALPSTRGTCIALAMMPPGIRPCRNVSKPLWSTRPFKSSLITNQRRSRLTIQMAKQVTLHPCRALSLTVAEEKKSRDQNHWPSKQQRQLETSLLSPKTKTHTLASIRRSSNRSLATLLSRTSSPIPWSGKKKSW